MSYYEDDFYGEPSEFEQQIDEFKQSLINCVKENYIKEMDSLKKENAELQEIKKNLRDIKNEYASKTRELENEKSKIMQTVRRERLSELMKDFQVILYYADTMYQKKPKCDKCDDNRQIHFLSPAGKDCTEYCECSNTIPIYIPIEYKCSEFKINSKTNKSLSMWFEEKAEKDYDYYHSTTYVDYVYDGNKSYDEIFESTKHAFFKNIDDCQKYCDWLNDKKGYQEISKNPVAPKMGKSR